MAHPLLAAAVLASFAACQRPDASGDDVPIDPVETGRPETGQDGETASPGDTGHAEDTEVDDTGEPGGLLVFHTYSSYDAWDAKLFALDLADHSLTELSAGWEIEHAMNAQISPDGSQLVFMGDEVGGDRDWDVFLYTLGSSEAPRNLTRGWGTRDEDPKFSPEGTLVLKSDRDLVEIDTTGALVGRLTDDGATVEHSMPFFTVDGARVVYAQGAGASSDLYVIGRDGSDDTLLEGQPDIQEYYPIVRDAETYLFTRWVSAENVHDQVYLGFLDGSVPRSLAVNDATSNGSDAYPYGDDAVFLSSTRKGGAGGYDLYVVDIDSERPVSLSEWHPDINTPLEELGATFHR